MVISWENNLCVKNMEKYIDKMEKGVYYNTNRKYNTNMYGK